MNYQQYKAYRTSLSASLFFLDDLNPYEMLPVIEKNSSSSLFEIAQQGEFIMEAEGVRVLLRKLFFQFSQSGHSMILPEDIYPVYFNLLPDSKQAIKYNTCNEVLLTLPDIEKAVLLIADPLMPEGKYLSGGKYRQLANWLNVSEDRWLLIDKVYDLRGSKTANDVLEGNVICIDSLSKKALTPARQGWAISNVACEGFNSVADSIMRSCYSRVLQVLYERAWLSIRAENIITDDLWSIPETGYLTTVNKNYKFLLNNNIAAIPATVYGVRDSGLSVISCLSQVKHEIR